jgi:hypothetical protein
MDQLKKFLTGKIDTLQGEVERFHKSFLENPAYAFEWADSSMRHAAHLRVFKSVLNIITAENSKATIESIRDYALRQFKNAAESPKCSTSVCINYMHQENAAAWVEVYDWCVEV